MFMFKVAFFTLSIFKNLKPYYSISVAITIVDIHISVDSFLYSLRKASCVCNLI